MTTFIPVNDVLLAERIGSAARSIVFVAPAITLILAKALGECFRKADAIAVTVILDPDEEPYRLGYGDLDGLIALQKLARDNHIALRCQPGLRIGLLVTDGEVLIWSPTPSAVEAPRVGEQPNGIDLGWRSATSIGGQPSAREASVPSQAPDLLSERLLDALAADDTFVPITEAEIGRHPFTPEQVAATKKQLEDNPPAPIDLARKTRVFSTRYQFVECELRGAAWTQREIKLSSLLLNSDLPPELQDLLETKVRPYSSQAAVEVEVPFLARGQIAYDEHGNVIVSPATQADLERSWKELLSRYLRKLEGFGWLIARNRKEAFEREVTAFERVLECWVTGFRKVAKNAEDDLVTRIVNLVVERATRSRSQNAPTRDDIEQSVRAGIDRLRVTNPSVKRVFKDIAWDSTRDEEFKAALRKALSDVVSEPWFEVFVAARTRGA